MILILNVWLLHIDIAGHLYLVYREDDGASEVRGGCGPTSD